MTKSNGPHGGLPVRWLEVFCAAYEAESFTHAAEALDLTQSTVSTHVGNLEKEIGGKLFDRLGRKVEPTPAGHLLYDHASRLLEQRRTLVREVSEYLHGRQGRLQVGASTIPGEYLLPRLLSRFQAQSPGIEIVVRVQDTGRTAAMVENGEVEVGLVGALAPNADLEFRELTTDRLVLAVPATPDWTFQSEVGLAELKRENLILRERGSGTRAALERGLASAGAGLEDFRVTLRLGSTTAVKEAVKAGAGVSVVSWYAVRGEVEAGLLHAVRITGVGELRRHFYTVVHRRRTPSPLTSTFLRFLGSVRDAPPPGD